MAEPIVVDWSQGYETKRTFVSPKGGAKPGTLGPEQPVIIPSGIAEIVTQLRRCGDYYVYMSGPKGGWSAIGVDLHAAFSRCAAQVPA